MTAAVLDSSAVLALLYREPGAEIVAELLGGGSISTVNWSEVLQRVARRGSEAPDALFALGLRVEPFLVADAARAAALWAVGRPLGLSLADRACLALADRLGAVAWTADRIWADADLGVEVRVVR